MIDRLSKINWSYKEVESYDPYSLLLKISKTELKLNKWNN